ncbi:MAG TPA: beta-propeller fold lactonase family protein [Acidobacteriaceae bacterium]|jgi:6-phosphogluconolactonase (cycloisomerase 2 family)|nr:beta-propeller fold lactonase family protein [Acidobacteriaceae bacterium]
MLNSVRGVLSAAMALGILAPGLSAGAQSFTPETVFVMSNNVSRNQVIAFQSEPNGSFQEQNRYDTFGRGTGGVNDPLESQGSLTLSQDHSLLFAANGGSSEITVFRVVGNRLFVADKEPSGGAQPVSFAQSGNTLYVLNSGGAGSVVGFHITPFGRLQQIPNSTQFLSANATGGSSISVSPDGRTVAVVERIANHIDIFHVSANGTISPAVVNPSPGAGAFAARFDPSGNLLVSETGPASATDGSAISSYTVQASGGLTPVTQSLSTDGAANCWNAISPNGKDVYVSNAGTSTIAGFTIGQGGALTPIDGTIVGSNPSGSTNLDIAISGDGKFLFSLNGEVGAVGVFAIRSDGSLEELTQAGGLPSGAGFNGIAAL